MTEYDDESDPNAEFEKAFPNPIVYVPLFDNDGNVGIIGDEKFTAGDEATARSIGERTAASMQLLNLRFTGDVVPVPPGGIRNVQTKVGQYAFSVIRGPIFDEISDEEHEAKETAKKASRRRKKDE